MVWSPDTPPSPSTPEGVYTPIWQALFANIQVGDWVRFEGEFNDTNGAEKRDYEVVALDTVNLTMSLQNTEPEFTLADIYTMAAGSPGVTSISFLRTVRGRQDQANAAGDYFDGTAQGIPFAVEILNATPSRITLAESLPPLSGMTNTLGNLIRGIPFRNSDADYDLRRRASTGFTGQVLVSYQAQRTDLSLEGLIDIGDQQDIEDRLGLIHPDNPLALMADMVTRSGLTSGNRVFFALATDGPTLSDFQAALDTLETEEVYFVVPATQDRAIIDAFWSHVESQSLPENKHERVLIASTPIKVQDLVAPAADNDPIPTGDIGAGTPDVLELTPGSATLALIKPGMLVSVLASADVNAAVVDTQRVKDVNSSTGDVTMLDVFDADATGNGVYFKVETFPRTKQQQAEYWRDEAASFNSERVSLLRPGEVQITYTDKTGSRPRDLDVRVPTHYAAAAFAGLCSSLPPQNPLTNVPLPGINRLFQSNNYFTPDQLDTIAEGGSNILIQSTRNAAVTSRHQLTTNMASLEERELSIRKAIDYAAKFFRGSFRPYIGNHNITRELLTQLRGIAESIIRGLVDERVMLDGSRLERLYQDPDQLDSVIVEVSLQVPYPINRIIVKLFF